MISQTAEYALRASVYLAGHLEGKQTLPEIAEATEVPAGYLSKVLQTLRKAGLVHSRRGKNGGFVLGREPESISLYDVVNAVSPIASLDMCPLTLDVQCNRNKFSFNDPESQLCPLHTLLKDMNRQMEDRFRSFNLSNFQDGSFRLSGISL